MSTLTQDERNTLQTAAYGVVTLLAAADRGKAGAVSTATVVALNAATGVVGHIINDMKAKPNLKGRTVADIADSVLPALTASVGILEAKEPAEAENFRRTIGTAVSAAEQVHGGRPHPAAAELIRKINSALAA
ncbi:hypothetical protein [Nocardia crassostreae]|uniref:hypothetical protein n=1 Tax=Nocardia crassostreae TaxID=53428 RepID=UPI0008347A5E|nr:hypothetical protein [Nocardia crassostreae]